MNTYKRLIAIIVALILFGLFAVAISAAPGPQRVIVVFDDDVRSAAAQQALIDKAGGVDVKDLNLINGKTVMLPNRAAASALEKRPGVRLVEEDRQVYALMAKGGNGGGGGKKPPKDDPPEDPPVDHPDQVMPWGVDRIDADVAWTLPVIRTVKVAVIDSGVQGDHPDLVDNYKGGYNAVNPRKQQKDEHGHGTHVAGTIAAYNNAIGVVGVAPEVDLYAIKVMGKSGMLWFSDFIDGLDWAVENDIDVVNISLGWSSDISSVKLAIEAAADAGVIIVVAAGNDGPPPGDTTTSVNYPARYSDVIAVSATDSSDAVAHWSSIGPEVDLAAPGADIYSTLPTYEVTLNNVYGFNQDYDYLSGTSMAAPHVVGAAALVIGTHGLDRSPESAAKVREQLAKAEDLGAPGPDYQFGSGLVDAEAASTP